ncbi:MAG: prolyl oligopeptidase family serine peptidase, partial [Bacillota bacterium]|nr:prolyl oligopeptidase family serine peptidase [Bacillota bacterium]
DLVRNGSLLKKFEAEGEKRFAAVVPQCCKDTWFEIFEQLLDFLDFIRNESFIDERKVYLTGASMGGYTSWQLAMTKPEWFAALAPICGGGMYWNAARLKDVPIWAFHGMLDPVVFVEESVKMVNAVNKTGGKAKLTVYENVQHDSWNNAYAEDGLFDWMLEHSK